MWAAPSAPYIQSERRDTYGKYARPAGGEGRRVLLLLREVRTPRRTPATLTAPTDPCRDLPLEDALRRVEAGEPYVIRQRIPTEGTDHVPRRRASATSPWKTARWTIRCC